MAKIIRYDGNYPAFGSDAQSQERTVFGAQVGDPVVQSNDLTENINANYQRGWGLVGETENPPKEWFNGYAYAVSQTLAYIHQMGIPEYNSDQEYQLNSWTSSSGMLYVSNEADNTGNDPASSSTEWTSIVDLVTDGLAEVATTGDYNDLSSLPTLGTAASRNVGTNAGNVMQVGAGGLLGGAISIPNSDVADISKTAFYRVTSSDTNVPVSQIGSTIVANAYDENDISLTFIQRDSSEMFFSSILTGTLQSWKRLWHNENQLSLGTTPASARDAMNLGTAATKNTGTGNGEVMLQTSEGLGGFGYGGGEAPNLPNGDADDIEISGFWRVEFDDSNIPVQESGAILHISRGARPVQLYMSYNTNDMWYRRYDSGGWQSWNRTLFQGEFGYGSGFEDYGNNTPPAANGFFSANSSVTGANGIGSANNSIFQWGNGVNRRSQLIAPGSGDGNLKLFLKQYDINNDVVGLSELFGEHNQLALGTTQSSAQTAIDVYSRGYIDSNYFDTSESDGRYLNAADNGSDIPNTSAFRNNLGLGTAATKDVGTSANNVMEVGAFGIGSVSDGASLSASIDTASIPAGIYKVGDNNGEYPSGVTTFGVLTVSRYDVNGVFQEYSPINNNRKFYRPINNGVVDEWYEYAFLEQDVEFRDITGRNIVATNSLQSDPKLKHERKKAEVTREQLDSISLEYFRWREDMEEVPEYLRGEYDIGVMADAVEKVFPECVKLIKGIRHVNYAKLGVCLTLADMKLRREGK